MTKRQAYVQTVLHRYCRLPDTPPRPRRNDRRLAERLHDDNIPLLLVEAALLLATTRRSSRPPDAPPLGGIRSLYYFLPVIEELRQQPLGHGYLNHLRDAVTLAPPPDPGAGPKNDTCL